MWPSQPPATTAIHTATAAAALEVQLFYRYVTLADPEAIVLQQQQLCQRLGLTGRMRIAHEGINGILCGPSEQLSEYRDAMAAPDSPLAGLALQYKLSPADGDPMGGELFVRVTDELTATGDAIKHHQPTVLGGAGGTHLCARDFHEAMLADFTGGGAKGGRRRVLIDTRNHYETAVGTFEGAIDPKIRSLSQFPSWVDANADKLEGADVFMFCTGGIRCEKASGYLRSLGVAASVNQLAGGIHAYLAEFSNEAKDAGVRTTGESPGVRANGEGDGEGDDEAAAWPPSMSRPTVVTDEYAACLWKGVNYTFDRRCTAGANGRVGRCCYCGGDWHEIDMDVICMVCKDQLLVCPSCRDACRLEATGSSSSSSSAAAAAATPTPSPDAVLAATAKGGVNFRQRLLAEANSTFMCVEHHVLSDHSWHSFLERAAQHAAGRGRRPQFVAALARAHRQLAAQLETSRRKAHSSGRSRTGRDRRKRLETQIERVAEWLAAEPEGGVDVASAPAGEEGFAPFFPLLGIWDEM